MRFLALVLAAGLPMLAADPSPDAVKRGQLSFKAACGFCHGDDATGSRAPDLIRSATLSHDVNGELLGPVIRNGRVDKGMPAFPMTDAQLADIVAFLHAQALAALHSNHVGTDYPLAKLLTGNVAAGKAYFDGAGGCASCHSVSGDLAGISKRYQPIDLQSRMLYPVGKKPDVMVTTNDGKQYKGALAAIDHFDVAMKDASGQYRSWPLDSVKVQVHDPLEAHRELLGKLTDADVHNLFAYLETLQ